ncbi:amidohydrolase [Streptosporangium violaceochromogenes]|nr:amidohydrolase [Streptosporangium violaceochromogenes]
MRAGGLLPVELPGTVREAVLAPLIDHHCRRVCEEDLTRPRFEMLITQATAPAPPGTTHFDTPAGVAVRRWCAPVLGLDPHAPPAVYLARRAELGAAEVNRRLLREAGIAVLLADAGHDGRRPSSAGTESTVGTESTDGVVSEAAGAIVGIERVEGEVAASAASVASYIAVLGGELAARAVRAAAFTSVIAHRHGLDFDPARPSRGAVIAAAGRRLAAPKERLTDPVLLRHLLWTAVDAARGRGLPLRFPTGHGGPGPDPRRADPALMTGFIRALQPVGVPVVLLRCHPFHRQAAHLAGAFPHVYVDLGPLPTFAATGSAAAVGELLELAPFHKQLFGSGARGVAETRYLGALYYRRGLARALAVRLAEGEWSVPDAARVAHMIGSGNARRIYRL